ncbi:M14 family metallopeptidase [Aureisphaera sp. CAU 1614]|uniref:M14 family metallopeptidase n=1 Tax=Halomarinibacterium sedimenti TaxID=2857106 RepID=A0A9X1JXG9_9FLAO|nr:M14 family metallopeptidase [Halomarinibacterium sedimenti]MBW2936557.1 M14 family metallopeptidase [Halomarinibacterium sedimenti]
MKKILSISFVLFFLFSCNKTEKTTTIDFITRFETSKGTETPTYEEVISYYKKLAETYPTIVMYKMGMTDSGEPLHLVVFNPNRKVDTRLETEFSKTENKNILLINNGIHPGESDGIDASMLLLRDFAQGKIAPPENTIIAVIPIYNIGGALNRNSGSRTNQNGPIEYGFRGNARNFDLNRYFIKADSKNAKAFAEIFHLVNPDMFIDNHVSNGADYQYTLTHLFTQHNKLGGELGTYLHTSFMPQLEDSLVQKKWDITPYVNLFNRTPETGFSQFMDYPRYSTGYTTLYNTLGMMVETHMLKPYKQRVEGTYELMRSFINIAEKDASKIKELRKNSFNNFTTGNSYPITWTIDSSKTATLQFKGYEGTMEPSNITGASRLKYHRDQPFTKPVIYYNEFKAVESIKIPSAYIIPKGYWNVIDQLKNNQITLTEVKKDTLISAEVYKIKNYETFNNPYEGHYPHYNTQVETFEEEVSVKKGDFMVSTQQPGIRYLLETLEPMAVDSFFNWNYFDTILQQKEGFSPYVWEDLAEAFLNEHPEIKTEFETKKTTEPNFAANWFAQLDWIHKQSSNYEKSHLRYPIVRVRG